jgi:small subunit ribosomal protein S21
MTLVVIEESDSVEWAIKAFRRKVQRAGILRDLRNKRHYVKPSTAKRKKAVAARRRMQRGRRSRR